MMTYLPIKQNLMISTINVNQNYQKSRKSIANSKNLLMNNYNKALFKSSNKPIEHRLYMSLQF